MVISQNGELQWNFKWQRYSSTEVCNQLGEKKVKVVWRNLIWDSEVVSKHSFICWSGLLNKLPIVDILSSWGLDVILLV